MVREQPAVTDRRPGADGAAGVGVVLRRATRRQSWHPYPRYVEPSPDRHGRHSAAARAPYTPPTTAAMTE